MLEITESNLNGVAETDPGYGQLLTVLIRRRFWLLGVLGTTLAIATGLTLMAKPVYQSSMQLLVESNYQGKNGENGAESQFADSNVQIDNVTQLSLMRSSSLLGKAVELLRHEYPDMTVKDLKNSLMLRQVEENKVNTKIFEANYSDRDPIKTQKVLKTIQQIYQDYNREQQQLRLAKGLGFIDAQLPSVRQNVIQSEAALERFRKSQNFVHPELQSKAVIEALKDVESELRANSAQYRDAQARYQQLQQQVATSPQNALVSSRLSESSRYQGLLDEIQKTELELAKQRLRFTDTNPTVQNLIQQRQDQMALLQQEMGRLQAGKSPGKPDNLLEAGQLGKLDVNLSSQLIQAQNDMAALRERDRVLSQKHQQLGAQLSRFPGLLSEYSRLEPEVKIKRDTLEQLLKARQELSLEIARGGFDWQVVEEPLLGTRIGPSMKQNLLLGGIVGLMLGGVAAFAREMLDDAVHTSDELKKQVDLPLLGITPELTRPEINEAIIHLPFRKPPTLASSILEVIYWPPFRESLDLIYQNIQLLNSNDRIKSIVVTSALAGEGKSTLALGLAMSAARLHQRVLLIDADLRRPSLHKQLDLPNEQGLSSLLASDIPARVHSGIQVSRQYGNISILTSGPTPPDPAQLLSSQKMRELIATFEQNYDLVLLDAPPVLGMVDAVLAASFCDAALMVGRIGRVTRTELAQATAMLSKLNAIGIVANGANGSTYGYQSYEKSAAIAQSNALK